MVKRIKSRKILIILFSLILALVGCSKNEEIKEVEKQFVNQEIVIKVKEFNKYGNVILDTTIDDLKENNIEVEDIINVKVGETTYEMPLGTSYSDVDSGNMVCRYDEEDGKIVLAINGGSFAETNQMAIKDKIEEDPGYLWKVEIDYVTFSLKEKGGYHDEYIIRNLKRSNQRSDYSFLSEEQFANCRLISCVNSDLLYRGTSPLDPDLGRNEYVMDFISKNKIKTILNLVDSKQEMLIFETYEDSYYASCNIYNAEMSYNFSSEEFSKKVVEAIRFILENEGPYFIHCKEGKDRTGIFCAILESYLGATYQEVIADYMQTYINFYNIEEDDETYKIIVNSNIEKTLCELFEVEDLKNADLALLSKSYLLNAGLLETELSDLKNKLID